MKISTCSERPLITPCGLERFNYQLDPYIGCGHYCYYCYVLSRAETDWRREVQTHHDIEGQLEVELRTIVPQPIYIGYHSDPYQPCESDHRQTRAVLRVLHSHGFSASILTKSDLVLRDLDILTEMEDASVSVSVAFNDEDTRRLFEENTTETARRVQALSTIKQAGIGTGVLLCPVVPYVTEVLELLQHISAYADTVWIYGLSVDSDREHDIGWSNTRRILENHFPGSAEQIQAAVSSRSHPYWGQLKDDIEQFNADRALDLRVHI
jgi:DNA repair photolyase